MTYVTIAWSVELLDEKRYHLTGHFVAPSNVVLSTGPRQPIGREDLVLKLQITISILICGQTGIGSRTMLADG